VGGSDWDQVTKDCSLDPGDVARLLSRTADLLRQVSRIGVLVIAHCAGILVMSLAVLHLCLCFKLRP